MNFRRFSVACTFVLAVCSLSFAARADGPATYDAFTTGLTPDRGLFTMWHKDGKLYLEIAPEQLDVDFVETIVPSTGTGGPGVTWGNTDHQAANLVRFERADQKVAILWPQPWFVAPHVPASARAIDRSFAKSVVALAPIAAVDAKTGRLIVDASCFLDDQMNLRDVLKGTRENGQGEFYALDRDTSYFGKTRAFPMNDVIIAKQDWTSSDQRLGDAVPDPRHVQVSVTYNLAKPPTNDGYVPRYSDDRVGIYNDVYLSFDNDEVLSRKTRYAVRWNLRPSDPSKPISPATHPMIFTMSDTIPEKYRPAIKTAVLKWNDAFVKIGISDAVQVVDQPNDPNFDPDDIRYNVLRWLTEYRPSFGADSQTLFDPRTGEEFRTGVLISAGVPAGAVAEWQRFIDPERNGRATDPVPKSYVDDVMISTILHETGHNLGLQHNFIGSRAYTARQLQDPKFTAEHGIASTVMEYAPLNLWPHGTKQGAYTQTVLGPYDYYAIKWTYGTIPGAATPEAEIPALTALASSWSDPNFRYASDEDVSWADGHASDPRVEQGILTNDPIGWCAVQLPMDRGLIERTSAMAPLRGDAFEDATSSFLAVVGAYSRCAEMPTHYIGGQYLSRAHRGDPHAEPPVVPVPRSEQYRAFQLLDRYVFAPGTLQFSPALLQELGTSEWAGYGFGDVAENTGQLPKWAYAPAQRHDIAMGARVVSLQAGAVHQMFMPLVLSRIADGEGESRGDTMHLADLFDWMRGSVYRELASGSPAIAPSRRALQASYAQTLVNLYAHPEAGTPSDARALARAELVALESACGRASARASDRTTRAHIDMLRALAHDGLTAGRPA